jgi:hypothetical protein
MKELFTDLETLPVADPKLIELISDGISAPKTMSKPETIAKWIAEERPLLVKEKITKTALDGAFGRICCIGYAFDDDKVKTIIGRDEKKLVTDFYADVDSTLRAGSGGHGDASKVVMIGHGMSSFDLKFLWKRSIVHGVKPHPSIDWQSKPWGEHLRDTMIMWDASPDKRISLHNLCKVLGIESPKEMAGVTGKDVAVLWAKRMYDQIAEYCAGDVSQMRLCYRKMTL